MKPDPQISVIVATRNRSASLRRLLEALAAQAAAPPFEVIVADNGGTDDTAAVVEAMADRLDVRRVFVETPGKSRALNAALPLARGSLIAFTDDDAVPDPSWLASLHAGAAAYPECGIFGGAVVVDRARVPAWARRSPGLMRLLTSEHDFGSADRIYAFASYPFGPNMAIRRELVAGAGMAFPESVGPGTALPLGDEDGFFLQVSGPADRDRMYLASARVVHDIDTRYLKLSNALRRCYQVGKAQAWLRFPMVYPKEDGTPGTLWGLLVKKVRTCGSVQELLCICARYLGYRRGIRSARRGSVAPPRPVPRSAPVQSRAERIQR